MADLAKYAAQAGNSKGRLHKELQSDYRDEYQRDRDRIIHSAAFRRLEHKTQVFINYKGSMKRTRRTDPRGVSHDNIFHHSEYRTRLTHSMEVAQIGRTIARALSLNEDLTEAICLAHDLGHTPFGHAGQDALNKSMADFGGFEHNMQSLRIVDSLEEKYAEFPGLNLTFETREGILKHCSRVQARSLGELGKRFLHRRQPGLEAQIANIADTIAYNHHDIDDGIRAGLIHFEKLMECMLFRQQYEAVKKTWPDLTSNRMRHEVIRRMINQQVSDLIETSQENIAANDPRGIDEVRASAEPMIGMSNTMQTMNMELKRFLQNNLYQHPHVKAENKQAKTMVRALFAAYSEDPGLLPQNDTHVGCEKKIADYIASMTDGFAIDQFNRIKT